MENPETSHVGKIVIAPGVLITIAKLSALSVPGVARMAAVPGGVDKYFKRGVADGVQIHVRDHQLSAELYVVVTGGVDVHAVSEAIQTEVAHAMVDMVGMEVEAVNVHIEDVAYGET